MSESADTLASQAQDLVSDLTENPVVEYSIRGKRVRRRENLVDAVKGMAMLAGLASSKRGFNVVKVDQAQ